MTKHLLWVLSCCFSLTACNSFNSSRTAELARKSAKVTYSTNPGEQNMVFIPSGSFMMGQSKENELFDQLAQQRKVSVSSFYMDETEVDNKLYRKFVNWVRDSIAITNYTTDKESWYMKPPPGKKADPSFDPKRINWAKVGDGRLIWNKVNRKKNPDLERMFLASDGLFSNKGDLDVSQLRYTYSLFDFRQAFAARNSPVRGREEFTFRDTVNVYPDTTVWVKDFNYSANDPLMRNYFSHPALANYPVVGVSWRQALAFTVWRTNYVNNYYARNKKRRKSEFRLPTEAEWEYAARGGLVAKEYPWGNNLKNDCDCLMANFKSGPGNYVKEKGIYTSPVKSFYPNGFGLYNMAGNVAEWTADLYTTSVLAKTGDLNPRNQHLPQRTDPKDMQRRVIKGGSWKDGPYFMRNAARSFEYQDTARSNIGFRTVVSISDERAILK
ncbi:SUMF1/EgtB/PvdO family nonheme iron enzyme [Pedobacter sp. SYP-B3415]|uniref:type IX secretion system lipoprotein PorK/GldK n=1 Tax=Pedobacter sp. SYP-B3415 TaxID=2496641 RepID=UPI00101D97E9|nr:SUMF1/EgtB/PvdO family nonheme iron enzyme [Pedobacter sp. SYP-B3415]